MEFVDFYLKFGGKLNPKNRWIRLANIIPWDEFEQDYADQFPSHTGNLAKPFRMALGALLIKEMKHRLRHHLWCIWRKRISKEILQEINERIVKRQLEKKQTVVADDKNNDDENSSAGSGDVEPPEKNGKEQPNRGNLLLDATCVPADIRFPTDLGVMNESREKLEDD